MRFGIRQLLFAIALLGLVLAWWFCPQATNLTHTGRELDLALVGPGYFMIEDVANKEVFYTRHCCLSSSATNVLVIGRSSEMLMLSPRIIVPTDTSYVKIERDGKILIGQNYGGTTLSQIGRITVVQFVNPGELREVKPDLYAQTDDAGVPMSSLPGQAGAGYVVQGWLEKPKVPGDPADQFDLLRWAFVAALVWLVYQVSIMRRQLDRLQADSNAHTTDSAARSSLPQ